MRVKTDHESRQLPFAFKIPEVLGFHPLLYISEQRAKHVANGSLLSNTESDPR